MLCHTKLQGAKICFKNSAKWAIIGQPQGTETTALLLKSLETAKR